MSDAETRALLREAESSGSGGDWLRAAWALVRAREWDRAGFAAARARAAGSDAGEVLAAMTPSLETFNARARAELRSRQRAWPVFSWSGEHVHVVQRDAIVAIDANSGEARPVGSVACRIERGEFALGPIAPAPDDRSLAVAFAQGRARWGAAILTVATGELSSRVLTGLENVRALAFSGLPGVVATEHAGGVEARRVDAAGRGLRGRAAAPGSWTDPALREHVAERVGKPLRSSIEAVVPSPSGGLAAVSFHARVAGVTLEELEAWRRVDLVHVATGASHTLALEIMTRGLPFELAWSPSGRKLALASPGESLVVLDADAPRPRLPFG